MELLERRIYRGPSLYAHFPVMRLTIDLGKLEAWPSGKIPGFKQLAQAKKLMGLDVDKLASMMSTPAAERGGFQAPKRNVDRAKEKRKRKDAKKQRKKNRR